MKFTRITSAANPRLKELAGTRKKLAGKTHDIFLIEGTHLIDMALSSGALIPEVFCSETFLSGKAGQKLLHLLSRQDCRMFEVTQQAMRKLADTETPQGIVAVVNRRRINLDELSPGKRSLFVAVDGIQDPGNLGAIIRTSDAAGADAVVLLPGTCDVFLPKTIRSTSGSIFTVPVVSADVPSFLEWLHARGIRLAVTAAHAGRSVFEAALGRPAAMVFGNEARGVSRGITDAADIILTIPIYGKAESLNVAAAAAVCIYEAVRRETGHGH